jgi:hypothetical protein
VHHSFLSGKIFIVAIKAKTNPLHAKLLQPVGFYLGRIQFRVVEIVSHQLKAELIAITGEELTDR